MKKQITTYWLIILMLAIPNWCSAQTLEIYPTPNEPPKSTPNTVCVKIHEYERIITWKDIWGNSPPPTPPAYAVITGFLYSNPNGIKFVIVPKKPIKNFDFNSASMNGQSLVPVGNNDLFVAFRIPQSRNRQSAQVAVPENETTIINTNRGFLEISGPGGSGENPREFPVITSYTEGKATIVSSTTVPRNLWTRLYGGVIWEAIKGSTGKLIGIVYKIGYSGMGKFSLNNPTYEPKILWFYTQDQINDFVENPKIVKIPGGRTSINQVSWDPKKQRLVKPASIPQKTSTMTTESSGSMSPPVAESRNPNKTNTLAKPDPIQNKNKPRGWFGRLFGKIF